MRNRVYKKKYIREVLLKDGTILKYVGGYSNYRYGMFEDETFESKEWSDLLKQLDYVPEYQGEVDRKKRVWVEVTYQDENKEWCRTKVYKDDFVSVKSYYEIYLPELKLIRMKDLIEGLCVEEFMQFMRDIK